jgi:hypothetical protein
MNVRAAMALIAVAQRSPQSAPAPSQLPWVAEVTLGLSRLGTLSDRSHKSTDYVSTSILLLTLMQATNAPTDL